MMPTSVQGRATDARAAARESLHLAATLYCDGCSWPVKICNVSSTGALVEGKLIPSPASLVQLVRGELIVHALVAWSADGRCGLKFSGSVDVQQWRESPSNTEQQRVDEIVRLVKAGAVPLPVPPLAHAKDAGAVGDASSDICRDLGRASELLEILVAVLASDFDIVTRHGTALQNLDIAMQVITAVEAIISGASDLEADATKLLGLRRSADQALQQSI